MSDTPENPVPQFSSPQPYTPPPAQPVVAAAPASSGSSALKIVLIIVAIFIGLGVLAAGVVGYGIYRVAHAVHKAANSGEISIPGSGFSANAKLPVSASDLGIAIYPGATQGKGGLHMTIAGKSMTSANYTTTDSKEQVMDFYKTQAGPNAQVMTTDSGGVITINNGKESTSITVLENSNSNNGKTQFTIIHTTGASS
jgi:hypothetical protein